MDNFDSRPLVLADVEQAAEVISQAFVDDPLCAFMLPFKRTRVKTLRKFFRAYGEVYLQYQCGCGVGEPLKGVAFWMEPNKPDISVSIKSLGLFIPLLFTFYPIGFIRVTNVLKQIDNLQQKYAEEPHYFLDNIGVLPSERGKGISSRLIRPFLEKADKEKMIVYTDTVTRTNVALYEHFGFRCMEECAIDGTGITVWALRRPIQS
jgi:ribosomal protein S18 acetylase RimI-like enzyme